MAIFFHVRDSDLKAWPGTPVVQLQTHPLFSPMQKQVEVLPDGSELWTYHNCQSGKVRCTTSNHVTTCGGGGTSCCHNQFFVKDGKVTQYRPVGNCYTDCSTRPPGKC